MALYLVTGGAGFIGSNIAEKLVETGNKVRVFDNLLTGKKENISRFSDKIDFIEGDIRDRTATDLATKGVDYILHEAALPSVQRSVEDPVTTNDINISGTLNLLISARNNGVKRFVFASSSSVYGDSEHLPKREDMVPNPLSAYALSKLTGEYYCKIFYDLYGLETICLRYFNVFGPRQDPQSDYAAVIPMFISAIISGRKPVIYGDGKQSRDFTFVHNVVEANLIACSAPRKAAGKVYNVACGDRYSLLCLLDNLRKISGVNVDPVFEKARLGDVKHSQADIEKAKKYLGLKPYVGFTDGLKKTFEWYKENNA